MLYYFSHKTEARDRVLHKYESGEVQLLLTEIHRAATQFSTPDTNRESRKKSKCFIQIKHWRYCIINVAGTQSLSSRFGEI